MQYANRSFKEQDKNEHKGTRRYLNPLPWPHGLGRGEATSSVPVRQLA